MNPDQLLMRAATHFAIIPPALRGRARTPYITFARHVAMWCMRRRCRMSSNEVAMYFGNRDHSTVLSASARIERLIASGDEQVTAAIEAILGPQVTKARASTPAPTETEIDHG